MPAPPTLRSHKAHVAARQTRPSPQAVPAPHPAATDQVGHRTVWSAETTCHNSTGTAWPHDAIYCPAPVAAACWSRLMTRPLTGNWGGCRSEERHVGEGGRSGG